MDKKTLICEEIRRYFFTKKISMAKAAKMLGVTPSAVTNHLGEDRDFSSSMAKKYSDTFGFNYNFLLTGEGRLTEDSEPEQKGKGIFIPEETVDMFRNMSDTIVMQQQNISDLIDYLSGKGGYLPKKSASILDLKK